MKYLLVLSITIILAATTIFLAQPPGLPGTPSQAPLMAD